MFKLCTLLKKAPAQPAKYFVRAIFVSAQKRTDTKLTKENQQEPEFETIYRFPHIIPVVFLNRLKTYQTILTGLAVPVSATLTHFNFIDVNTALYTCAVGAVICLPLYSFSYLFKNLVGFVYVNEDGTKTKIAYLDYWGKRVDMIVNSDDIIPFSQQPQSFTDRLYFNLCRYSTKDKLKINMQFGEVINYGKFAQIFSTAAFD